MRPLLALPQTKQAGASTDTPALLFSAADKNSAVIARFNRAIQYAAASE
jgi:hypothetical protein